MRLTILSSLDALCRQRACDMLSSAYPTATLMLHDLMEDNVLGRRTVGPDSSVQRAETVLEHPCPSCAVRLEIAPAIQNAREHGVEHLILALPPTLPAAALVQALADLPRRSVMLNAVVLACAPGSVEDQVWDPHTLFESGYLVLPQDERTPGEFLMEELAFTETVLLADPELVPITPFERARGVQLVQELAPHARITDRGTDIEARTQHLKNRAGHSPRNGLNRAPSTPDSAFTTVVHHLHRPLHPQRFHHALHSLAPDCARLRGELWMAPVPECRILLRGAGPRIWLKNVGPWASHQEPTIAETPGTAEGDTPLHTTGITGEPHTVFQATGENLDVEEFIRLLTACELTEPEMQAGITHLADPFGLDATQEPDHRRAP